MPPLDPAGGRPRVALVCQSLTSAGGTERVVATLGQILSDRFEVYEFSFDSLGSTRYFDSPAKFVPLGRSLKLPLYIRPISYLIDALRLRRAKRSFGIEFTISNLWRADLLSVVSMGTDRKVTICHTNFVGNASNSLLLRFRRLVSQVYRQFDRVVSVSRPLGEEIHRVFQVEKSKVVVIHNCVPQRKIEDDLAEHPRTRMVWCGRFSPEKNILTLIKVFAGALESNRLLQFILIGDGVLRQQAELLMRDLNLKIGYSLDDRVADIILTGTLRDPVSIIAQCEFQVLPSISEGLGLVLIEGFSVAIPALASDGMGGGVHDAMGGASRYCPGRTEAEKTSCGFLLPVPDTTLPKSFEIWRSHMVLLAGNPKLRKQLSAGAKERSRVFSSEVIAPQWLQLIEELR